MLRLANATRYFSTNCPAVAGDGAALALRYGLLQPTLFRTGERTATRLPGEVLLVHLNFMSAGAEVKWREGLQSHYTAEGYDANGPMRPLWHATGE